MRPLMPRSTMCRPSAWQSTKAASRLTASISRHCASLTSSTVWLSCRRGLAHRELERHAAAVDLDDLHVDGHLQAKGRRRQMVDRYMRADRILAGIEMFQQEIATGVLHVAHHARRRVDHALLAHEADAAA